MPSKSFPAPVPPNDAAEPQGDQGVYGDPGPQGQPGDVSSQPLTDAIAGTSITTNAVDLLEPNADLPTVIAKVNELINALRR